MSNKKLNQRDVDRVHRLHREGLDAPTIASRFSVHPSTVHYVLKQRPSAASSQPFICAHCGKGVGSNRKRTLKGYHFCPSCHDDWLFKPENYGEACERFKGVF